MFSALQSLPLSVPRVAGESATSLAARLARRNGAPRLITFCSDMGLDHRGLTNGSDTEIFRLAALAGCAPDLLRDWTPRLTADSWFRLGQERIKFTAFARTRIRACPTCLADGENAHQAIWQLSSIRRCGAHGCLLIELPASPGNKEVFDFAFHATRVRAGSFDTITANESQLENYLLARIQDGAGDEWIDRLPFHVAAQTSENLGALILLGPDAPRDLITEAEWHRAGSIGFSILKNGPEGLCNALKELQRAVPLDAALYRTRYRLFFDWLRYRDDDRDFDIIRDLVREFIFQNYPVAEGAVVLGKPCPRQLVHSISTASRAYGVTRWQLGRRLTALGLAQRSADDRDFRLTDYVPTEMMDQIAGDFAALMNAGDAAKWLGIARFLLTKLTDGGVVQKFFTEKHASPLYHPRDLEDFISDLDRLAEGGQTNQDWLDIPTAAHRLHCPTDRVTAVILKLHIPLRSDIGCDSRFRAFRVHLPTLHEAISCPVDGALPPGTAARMIGVGIRTLRALIDGGYVESVMAIEPQSGRLRRYISENSLEEFRRTHITVTQLAARTRRNPGAEAIIQADCGIAPLPLPERCQTIYRCADIG
ncbi:TniQ family protein [Rhodobacter sp. 24-YEA-8]|uniref:TniQ family protein n=1 Tax=Rhodobacter sp. 24-YEA-8 TaxID=1884310 RepID=UPI00089C2E51|nr:TniQ family protein [Rhodobacter sp. 24-YEA-8]SEC39520.1 TniQ protein [Rhodobacter sp. 24-YEA-8]